ncbi:hypothetical protein EV383_2505 [Pseudonocardia sediminis]|uniref:Uncharacterized protein n=1 Tax=Pseudonocardia sediminis TaxID=1397368 RepID=A0A4Q7UZJ4_PSEST|nr:hypothetical protein EV383_2505 [Pseudonocardia sediminis]
MGVTRRGLSGSARSVAWLALVVCLLVVHVGLVTSASAPTPSSTSVGAEITPAGIPASPPGDVQWGHSPLAADAQRPAGTGATSVVAPSSEHTPLTGVAQWALSGPLSGSPPGPVPSRAATAAVRAGASLLLALCVLRQ